MLKRVRNKEMQRFTRTLMGMMLLVLIGCQKEAPPVDLAAEHAPYYLPGMIEAEYEPEARPRVDRTPKVLDDPEEIAKLQKRCDHWRAERYAWAIERLDDEVWSYDSFVRTFREMPEKAKADLKRMMNDTNNSAELRAFSASALADLGSDEGGSFLLECLTSDDANLRYQAVNCLPALYEFPDFSIGDRAERVLALLEDPDRDIANQAAVMCRWGKIPEAEERMVKVLNAAGDTKRPEMAESLAVIATRGESVEALAGHIDLEEGGRFDWGPLIKYNHLIRHKDPALSGPIRRFVFDYAMKFPDERYHWQLAGRLAECAGPEDKEVLLDILANAKDGSSRAYAAGGLARLEPEKGVDILLEFAETEGGIYGVAGALSEYAGPEDFPRIKELLLKTKGPWRGNVVHLCYFKLGPEGRSLLEEHSDRISPELVTPLQWRRNEWGVRGALEEFQAAGMIDVEVDKIIEELRADHDPNGVPKEHDLGSPATLLLALEEVGIMDRFDIDCGGAPAGHEWLLRDMAKISRGKFTPQCVDELWLQMDENDEEAPYLLQFLADGRLYQVGVENYGDWFDLEPVLNLANFYLEEAGHKERFQMLEGKSQWFQLIFADPDKLAPLAEKYGLKLTTNLRQPLESARAE